ncbi:hypothetical protein PoMZ_12502 [Pyricularia oryzae]|uniref:Uncharacterized protein n=1 Tax=Pyricularia oryzae TaxID=318829 RepID=A0A4P7NT20_PYROR|nr:hypothetical protein PoMZ_12502 [Pyricularia oryzae]
MAERLCLTALPHKFGCCYPFSPVSVAWAAAKMHILDPAIRGSVSGWRKGQRCKEVCPSSLTTAFLEDLGLRISNGKDR